MQGNVAMGGLSAAVDHYSEVPTPNVLIIEFDVPSEEMMEGLEQLAEICDPGCQRRSKIGPKGGVKLVHFL